MKNLMGILTMRSFLCHHGIVFWSDQSPKTVTIQRTVLGFNHYSKKYEEKRNATKKMMIKMINICCILFPWFLYYMMEDIVIDALYLGKYKLDSCRLKGMKISIYFFLCVVLPSNFLFVCSIRSQFLGELRSHVSIDFQWCCMCKIRFPCLESQDHSAIV